MEFESFFESVKNNVLVYILLVFAVIALLVFFIKITRKKSKRVKVTETLIIDILDCFKESEILGITSEVSRVKFEVDDVEKIDYEKLKKISTGVFVSGNNVKVMFKDSADEIVETIKNKGEL